MCGIVGYIGTKQAEPILINGLYKLEYRGYDSAGIATLEDSGIKCVKQKGRVNAEIIAKVRATPALGPSFGTAPSGT